MMDILERAKRFEESVATYYTAAAKHASDPEVKSIFYRLAGEEQSHIKIVDDVLDGLTLDPEVDGNEFPSQ